MEKTHHLTIYATVFKIPLMRLPLDILGNYTATGGTIVVTRVSEPIKARHHLNTDSAPSRADFLADIASWTRSISASISSIYS